MLISSGIMSSLQSVASILQLPVLALVYVLPRYRQDRDWTYRQAFTSRLVKAYLRTFTAIRAKPSLSLEPRFERDCFTVTQPAQSELYRDIAVDDDIQPEAIGGTWYPEPFSSKKDLGDDRDVILHLHGGSYVLGDGRMLTCRYLANTLLAHTSSSYILCLQYRLACNANGRFPAQLQDAITAYSYLIHTLRIPPSRIVLSGDSSGGHLSLMLLRYITQLDDRSLLPPPKCSWLFSPWCDVPAARDPTTWKNSPNYKTEFVPSSFPAYGARQFLGDVEITEDVERYVAPIWHPFVVPSPVLIVTGGREVLCHEHEKMARDYRALAGDDSRVEFYVEEMLPHDVLMIGWIMNFRREAQNCVVRAGEFATNAARTGN